MAANVYHEIVQVEVRDQSQAALQNVQKNVEKTEQDLNRISKNPFNVTVKVTDLLTRGIQTIINGAMSLARKGLQLPVTILDRATAPFRNMMAGLREQGNQIVMGIGQGLGQGLLGLAGQGFGAVKDSIIGMNATLETSTLQFETLMGSTDAAQAHVADLFEFAKKTPFETQPVIDASRLLRTFGGSALDTMDNLTLFGNASAATSSDIKDVSFWFGRAYAAIQAGQPFGEARMRLQELAILSPQAAQKLEQLEKSGAKGDVIWKAMTQDLNRFNGAMDRQAGTWEGLTSTLSDSISLTSAKVFKPLFDVAKNALGSLTDALSSDQFSSWAESTGKLLADMVGNAGKLFGRLITGIQAVQEAFSGDTGAIGVVYDLIRETFGDTVADYLQPFLQSLMDFIPTLRKVGTWLGHAFEDLTKGDVRNVLIDISIALGELTGTDMSGFTAAVISFGEEAMKVGSTILPLLVKAAGDLFAIFTKVVQVLSDAWKWLEQHKAVQAALVGLITSVTTAVVAYNVAQLAMAAYTAITTGATSAFSIAMGILNAVMMANPIFLVIGLLAGLAAALIFAYKTNDDFRNAVDTAWAAIQQAIMPVIQMIGDAVNWLWHTVIEPAIPSILQLWEDLKNDTIRTLLLLPLRLHEIGFEMINNLITGMGGPDVLGWIRTNITDKIPDFIKDALGIHSPSSVFADIGNNLMQGLINGLTNRLPDIMAFVSNLSNVFGGTDVAGWIDAAIRATGVPISWAGPLSQIIQNESGGNPMASNLTDINAQNGDASVGLMQLTGSNRAAYTPAGMDPMDPIAQIIAGIRYIQDRYGDIGNVPGVRSLAAGGAYQPYDAGGILPPGLTMAANNTGQNEFVFTPDQLASLGGSSLVFAPQFNIDATGASPGVGEEIGSAVEEQASRMFALLGTQLRVAFGNLASEGGAT